MKTNRNRGAADARPLCWSLNRYIARTSAALQSKTDAAYSVLQFSSFPEAHHHGGNSHALWQQCRAPPSALVRHNELDEIDRLYGAHVRRFDNTDQNGESPLQLRESRAMLRAPRKWKATYANSLKRFPEQWQRKRQS